jgi:hypothetical protein
MSPKIILPTGTSADLLDNIDSTSFATNNSSSEQILSASEVRIQSTTSTKKFTIEYNETENSLDFNFSDS